MRLLVPCLMLVAAAAAAQSIFTYSDKNTSVRARDGLLTHPGSNFHVELSGGVVIVSKSQSFRLEAARVVADVAGEAVKGQKAQVKTATATGGAHIDQTVSGAAGKHSTVDATKAVYVAQGSGGVVTLTGAVKITSVDSKRRMMIATGSSGVATLDPNAKSSQGLKAATLRGPVTVDIQENDKGGHIIAHGDRLDVNNAARPVTLILTGHVTIQGRGNTSFGTMSNVGKVVIRLNEKGEFLSAGTE